MATVPVHDLRRDKTDDADLDVMLLTRAVGQFAVEQHIGFHKRFIVAGLGADFLDDIGAHHREVCTREGLHQEIEPVVELMIAQG